MNLGLHILLFILSFSNRNIEGNWMRVEDEWAGMIVNVKQQDSSYVGKVVHVPKLAHSWGFRKGDIKWKLPQFNEHKENHYTDLYINKDTGLHYYNPSVLKQISTDTIETHLIKYGGEYIGNTQRWIRLSDEYEVLTNEDKAKGQIAIVLNNPSCYSKNAYPKP